MIVPLACSTQPCKMIGGASGEILDRFDAVLAQIDQCRLVLVVYCNLARYRL